jgi:hypothetical protein
MATDQGTAGPGGLSRIPFTVEAENHIRSLAFWLGLVGWLNVVAGVFDLLNLVFPARNIGHLFNAILHFAIGVWAIQAASAFKNVATTDVADQAYLVEGFTKLRSIFLLQGIVILVGLAFLAAVLLFLLLHGVNAR